MFHLIIKLLVLSFTLMLPSLTLANDIGYSVLGVIASSKGQEGVALLKSKKSSKVSAFREGAQIKKNLKIVKIYRKNVDFDMNGKILSMKVGDEEATFKDTPPSLNVAANMTSGQGFEKKGDTLTVNRELKDELVNNNLSKILMQAAAVPHVKEGRLVGFQLLEIDSGSIYEVAGLQNGDVITHINQQPINDAGRAIKALSSLKTAASASFNYLRQDQSHELVIKIN